MTWSDRVPATLARALIAQGFDDPTPVQRAVLAVEPATRDMLVSAPTGSGKTLAFGLALAPRLLGADGRAASPGAPRALVIAPTRELARQVAGALGRLYVHAGLRVFCCTGGADPVAERARLAAGCELVVGTPGRLCDHVARGALATGALAAVVIDEADDLVDLGFRDDTERLLAAAPPERQVLMFSATITLRAAAFAARLQRDAARIAAPRPEGADSAICFEGVAVGHDDREAAVANLLRFHEPGRAIVFCATRDAVTALAARLAARGFPVVALSGALSQAERCAAVAALHSGRAMACVATDLAARGLDVPGLDLVIHADLPASEVALVHRSGRAGRGGPGGRAVLVVAPAQRRRAEALARRAGIELAWRAPPDRAAILARDESRLCAETSGGGAAAPEERAAAARLIARHGAETVAVAYLRGHVRARPAPATLAGRASARRFAEGAWFALESRAPISRRRLHALVCRIGRLARGDVGAILSLETGAGTVAAFEIRAATAQTFETEARRGLEPGLALHRLPGPPPR